MSKKKIRSPIASLNGYDASSLKELFNLELEASLDSMNKAQRQVIEAYSGYQPIAKNKTGFMGKGLSMIEKMVLKNVKATSQTYLYHSITDGDNPFQGVKIGDTVTVESVFTASANPIFAQSMSEANGVVLIIEKAKATPLPDTDPDDATYSYVIASNAQFKLIKAERRTWVHNSKISKNVSLLTVEML